MPVTSSAPSSPLHFPEPPTLLPRDWESIAGQIGAADEDFRVDEIPLYEPCGEGEHLYLRLEKRGITTQAVVRELASLADVSPRDVGYAGMKDRHAVTTQWFSVPTVADPTAWNWSDAVTLLDHSRHQNKLKTGHLRGNRFQIRLVGLSDVNAIIERAQVLAKTGVLNGFDAQRFGFEGRNLDAALAWARQGGGRVSPFQRKLHVSVLQAHVFNTVLKWRAERDWLTVQKGDVLRLDGSHSVFVSEDPTIDEQRRLEHDVHLTGPIFGPKTRQPQAEPAQLENQAVQLLNLDEKALKTVAKSGQGTRRDIFICPAAMEVAHSGEGAVTVSFALESGAYATNVIRHLLYTQGDTPLREHHEEDNA